MCHRNGGHSHTKLSQGDTFKWVRQLVHWPLILVTQRSTQFIESLVRILGPAASSLNEQQ